MATNTEALYEFIEKLLDENTVEGELGISEVWLNYPDDEIPKANTGVFIRIYNGPEQADTLLKIVVAEPTAVMA